MEVNNMALDENKKTEFLKELNEAREDKDYAWVVEIAAEIADAGDNDWAKIILKETEDALPLHSSSINPLLELGAGACNIFDNKEWGKSIYEKVEFEAYDVDHYLDLSIGVAKNLNDKEWARKLFEETEEITNSQGSNNADDYCYGLYSLANGICEYLKDKDWAIRLYQSAENRAKSYSDLQKLGRGLSLKLGDMDWGRKVFSKGLELVRTEGEDYEIENYEKEFDKIFNS